MPVDYYPNKSLEDLTALLNSLQSRQVKGSIVEVSVAGVRTVRQPGGSGTSRTETEILRVLYSMHLRAAGSTQLAEKYPNPYAGRIRRTRARYTFS